MPVIYEVTITPAGIENHYTITWFNPDTNTRDSFDSRAELSPEETGRMWEKLPQQLPIGQKLFRFLDGDARHFKRALEDASRWGESLLVHLRSCKQTSDWPFELLAQEDSFLLPYRLHLVRNVSDWGKDKEMIPQDRPLKLLFMASSPIDIEPELDFEREEEAIFRVTAELPIDMEVEDSGSLEGLHSKLEQEQYDVVHLSGHAGIDKNGRPYFIMEDESGLQQRVFPEELWNKALIENPPRLLFLSGCRTGEVPEASKKSGTPANTAEGSFARLLVENNKVPAVLGWGRSVNDDQAIIAGNMLFHELSRGRSILEAVQRTRIELVTKYESGASPAWPLVCLFSSGIPLNAVVTKGQWQKPQPRKMAHVYLKKSRVQILTEGFVGRRRQLQQSLRALKHDPDKIGVLLLGTGGLGKSCLAGKIIERFPLHSLIIVHGKFNTLSLAPALKDAFFQSQDKEGLQIFSRKGKLIDQLANLCSTCFKQQNYLLLLDDFEQNMDGECERLPGVLLPEAAELLMTLLHYLPNSGNMTQLIITCRYDFSLTEQGQDLVEERLEKVWLTSFQESEKRKKAQELEHISQCKDHDLRQRLVGEGLGNPLLMEWVDVLVGKMKTAEIERLLEAIEGKQEEFVRRLVLHELVKQGGNEMESFLQILSIYRHPVEKKGVEQVVEKAGLQEWEELLKKGMGLSLVEFDRVRQVYRLTPLLRDEMFKELKEKHIFHLAAFDYYKTLCESLEVIDPVLNEEWIYHALGCGELKTAVAQGICLVKHLRDSLASRESRRIGEWVLDEKKKKQELSDINDATLLNETAFSLKSLGDFNKAIEFYEKALVIDRSIFGDYHESIARDLNNLGNAWREKGEPGKAIDLLEQSLTIFNRLPGNIPPYLAAAFMNNLGSAWIDKHDYPRAIEYLEKALELWKKELGDNHLKVAIAMNNLGSAWNKAGDTQKAIRYHDQALKILQPIYGEIHPEVATVLNNLGSVWYQQEDYNKALSYYKRALAIWIDIYGKNHPNVAAVLNKQGELLKVLDKPRKALDVFEQALPIVISVYGAVHSHTAAVLDNIGSCWRFLEEYEKAIRYYERALAINRSLSNQSEEDIAFDLANIGKAYISWGKKEKGTSYLQEAETILKKVFGPDHAYTKAISKWLAE
jgi:tetratricopeptide (TPR) repeat protein